MIHFNLQPTAFYPVFNDSYLSFLTDYTEDSRAVISVEGFQFTIYPDNEGNYLFNLREVAKAIVNTNRFRDSVGIPQGWTATDSELYKEITVDITAYGDGSSESTSAVYSFNKAVRQYGDELQTNPYQIMLPSKDGINYSLTYFEGFPLDITFRYVNSGTQLKLKNNRTNQVSQLFTPTLSGPYRLFIDKSLTNWQMGNVLDIPDMTNRVDVMVGTAVKTSLEITKHAARCGKYLKWFNADGSYSYWLFHQWYKQDHAGKEIDRISTNNFNNIYSNSQGLTTVMGKAGESGLKLKTLVTEEEKNHLISLITSPMVQMWSKEEPFSDGEWLDVKVVSNGFTYSNKKSRNQLSVDIELPEVNTQLL